MKNQSCKTCKNAEFDRKEELSGRLAGRYRYGCSYRKSGYICGAVASDDALEALICEGYCDSVVMAEEAQDSDQLLEELDHRMENLFDRWLLWKEQGAPGAAATDGEYLNRLRTGLERLRYRMEELVSDENYPENYYAPLPPEIPESYMANIEQIKQQAEKLWIVYQGNPDYQWLAIQHSAVKNHKNDKNYEIVEKVLSHVQRLKSAVEHGEPLAIKRELQQRDLQRTFYLCRIQLERREKSNCKISTAEQKKSLEGQMDFEQLKAS